MKFSEENTLNSRQNGKILSSYRDITLHSSDVYNLAQKLENSVQIVMKITQVTHHGGKLSRVDESVTSYPLQSVYRAGRKTLFLWKP